LIATGMQLAKTTHKLLKGQSEPHRCSLSR